ncbi:MAG TPA: Os1348 family NHLP clan protein [Candidatus Limnocylindria bacterium]|nr:Os1348 family NHLP clan protein [Candidatus Limnocylindria bacterium]
MSKEALAKVVQRAISDAAFRRQLSTDPAGALRGFDLSADESAAIRTGDAGRLSALGVDQRMSKAYALSGLSLGATKIAGSDVSASRLTGMPESNASAFAEANASGTQSAFNSADQTGSGGSFGSALVDGSDANAALINDGASGVRTIIPTEPQGANTADASNDEGFLTTIGYDSSGVRSAHGEGSSGNAAIIPGSPEETAAALRDGSGGVAGAGSGTAYIDDGEGFGVGLNATQHEHTWSGDDIAGPSTDSSGTADMPGTEVSDVNQTP